MSISKKAERTIDQLLTNLVEDTKQNAGKWYNVSRFSRIASTDREISEELRRIRDEWRHKQRKDKVK